MDNAALTHFAPASDQKPEDAYCQKVMEIARRSPSNAAAIREYLEAEMLAKYVYNASSGITVDAVRQKDIEALGNDAVLFANAIAALTGNHEMTELLRLGVSQLQKNAYQPGPWRADYEARMDKDLPHVVAGQSLLY